MKPEYIYLINIGLAAGLSLAIGIEREFQQKQAGIRTHMLVGMGAALFMVVSKYGFFDLMDLPGFSMDGSRIAAQVASGVGFLGAGLIFVRRNNVRGLTTAASIWLVAAVGVAAGAGMYWVSSGVVLLYVIIATVIRPLGERMPKAKTTTHRLQVRYLDGKGLLRSIIASIAEQGLNVSDLKVVTTDTDPKGKPMQDVILELRGSRASAHELPVVLNQISGVISIEISGRD